MKTFVELEGTPDSCKVDGNNSAMALVVREYKLTIIDSSHLPRRLVAELHFVEHELKLVWPDLKRDPLDFGVRGARASLALLNRVFVAPNVTALLVVVALVALVLVVEKNARFRDSASIDEGPDVIMLPPVSMKYCGVTRRVFEFG